MEKITKLREIQTRYVDVRPFSLDDTGVTHRELTYWDEKNLLPVKVESQKWRRFNLIELAWIRFIANLRRLNVGLSTMQRIREEMFANIIDVLPEDRLKSEVERALREKDPSFDEKLLDQPDVSAEIANYKLSIFESFLYSILLDGAHISIAIAIKSDSTGDEAKAVEDALFMEPIFWDKLFAMEISPDYIDTLLGTCISISLNEIIADVYKSASINKLARLFALSEQETKILETLRKGTYREVTVRFMNNGIPELIEATEKIKLNKSIRLVDVLTRGAYEEFNIQTQAGDLIHVERKIKTKLQ